METQLTEIKGNDSDDLLIAGFDGAFENGSTGGFQMAAIQEGGEKTIAVSVSCSCVSISWSR
jgi:hypothetical protein